MTGGDGGCADDKALHHALRLLAGRVIGGHADDGLLLHLADTSGVDEDFFHLDGDGDGRSLVHLDAPRAPQR